VQQVDRDTERNRNDFFLRKISPLREIDTCFRFFGPSDLSLRFLLFVSDCKEVVAPLLKCGRNKTQRPRSTYVAGFIYGVAALLKNSVADHRDRSEKKRPTFILAQLCGNEDSRVEPLRMGISQTIGFGDIAQHHSFLLVSS
jgi:hypothetical protein